MKLKYPDSRQYAPFCKEEKMPEGKTAAEEIREALTTKLKAQVLELIDPELVRRHMSEIIIEEVERLFRSFSFTSELENAVEVALREKVTSAMALVMADASTQQRIKQTVEAAVQKGIDNTAATISKRVESTLTGSRSYP